MSRNLRLKTAPLVAVALVAMAALGAMTPSAAATGCPPGATGTPPVCIKDEPMVACVGPSCVTASPNHLTVTLDGTTLIDQELLP